MMMKRTLVRLFVLSVIFLFGGVAVGQAQRVVSGGDAWSVIYSTSKQKSMLGTVQVESIEFGPRQTVVTLRYQYGSGGANLWPTTRLVCHLRGGHTRVLELRAANGITTHKAAYSQFKRGDTFQAIFPGLPADDIEKVKRVDFLEDEGNSRTFNITDIKIDRKAQVIR